MNLETWSINYVFLGLAELVFSLSVIYMCLEMAKSE